jgi:predicted ATPase/class 3 adenylate cyclase
VSELPSGTVTFLFTDIEGSTRLWEEHRDAMHEALARHDELLRDTIERHGGYVVKTTGDGVHAAFGTAEAGLAAAVDAQRDLDSAAWPLPDPLRVRMGLHTGAASLRDGDYFGASLNRAARLMGVAHGGQIVCSEATADLARDTVTDGVTLADLGEHRLRDLSRAERVFQVCAPGLAREFAALTSIDAFPTNLPLQVSSFIGREREIERTVDTLAESRVVTLTGVGGVGKTRLAYQVAAHALPDYREGAWLVELAAVRDPDGVVDAFASVFGVTARAGQSVEQSLIEFLGTKQLLLVVDNCEHVLDAVADLVEEIGRSCPGAVVLATSREALVLDGERILGVPALGAPDAEADLAVIGASDAVQLFVDRARAADADFALTADNASAVASVCRRLDGVPLAIELAAAKVDVMTPAELLSALDRRFDVLAGGRRRAVKRQQTLRATIDWSYDLLDEPHQRLLARLAVFAGGCTREGAEAVCAGDPLTSGAVFGLLTDLVKQSLVDADRDDRDTRYRLLETIREYGEERLVEHDEAFVLRDRHAHHFADYALRCHDGQWGPEQIAWGTRMTADADNILSAFDYAVDTQDLDLAVELLYATGLNYGGQTGFPITLSAESVLAMPGVGEHPGHALVLLSAALEADARGEPSVARKHLAAFDAEVVSVDSQPSTTELNQLRWTVVSSLALAAGDWEAAATSLLEAADLSRLAGNNELLAIDLGGAANALCVAGRYADAVPIAIEGLALARASGMPTAINFNLLALAQAVAREEPERARALLHEASRNALDYEGVSELTQMTFAAATIHDWPLTAQFAARTIRHLHWINQRPYLGGVLNLAARALADADPEGCAVIQGAAYTLAAAAVTEVATPGDASTSAGTGGGLITESRREATRLVRQSLGDEQLRALRDRGAAMDIDDAVAFAIDRLEAPLERHGGTTP